MKRSIVFKLFLLTSGLCLFILAVIFVGQTVFFKQFYVHQKVKDVKAAFQDYEQDYLNHATNKQAMAELEQDFYQKYNTWITTLDAEGNLKHTDDFFMEIKLDRSDDSALSNKTITVPLYTVINVEDFITDNPFLTPWINEGERIAIAGDFRKLTPLVLMRALAEATTQIYEPIHRFELEIPVDSLSRVLFKLTQASSTYQDPIQNDQVFMIHGMIPIKNIQPFENQLPGWTQGEGVFLSEFHGYQPFNGEVPLCTRYDHNPLNRKEYLLHTLNSM
ncbi:hypothetical protein [Paenibacillus glacialis]|uniref:Elongation factor EFG domain-containing protein n=1 Tax=Paenibacillus glacialis TaxID=494026 RepID=A0A168KUJ1_9BACL|nr:hypothetical protein [Paenibacillus glacialis]OAB42480.1 hypothetical protein PGLA_12495 [Paenibacillus glacialis]